MWAYTLPAGPWAELTPPPAASARAGAGGALEGGHRRAVRARAPLSRRRAHTPVTTTHTHRGHVTAVPPPRRRRRRVGAAPCVGTRRAAAAGVPTAAGIEAQGAAHELLGAAVARWRASATAARGPAAAFWHRQPVGGFGGAPACVHGALGLRRRRRTLSPARATRAGAAPAATCPCRDPPCGRHGTCDARKSLVRLRPRPLWRGLRAHKVRARLRRAARHVRRHHRRLQVQRVMERDPRARSVCPALRRASCATRRRAAVCASAASPAATAEPLPGRWEAVTPDASDWPRWSESTDATTCAGAPLLLLDGSQRAWRLDPTGDQAARLTPTSVAAPAPRRGAAVAGAADRGVVVVHGGLRMQSSGGTAATDELWALHCANGTSWVAPDAVAVGAAAAMIPRAYHADRGGRRWGRLRRPRLRRRRRRPAARAVPLWRPPLRAAARGGGGARGDGGGAHAAQGV